MILKDFSLHDPHLNGSRSPTTYISQNCGDHASQEALKSQHFNLKGSIHLIVAEILLFNTREQHS